MLHKIFINIAICLVVYMSLGTSPKTSVLGDRVVRQASTTEEPCSSPWKPIYGKCLLFTTKEGTWNEMELYCRQQGGQLIKLDNGPLFKGVRNHLRILNSGRDYWIGLSDAAEEGTYKFLDGTIFPSDSCFWGPFEPNNYEEKEDRVELSANKDYRFNDNWGQSSRLAICEKN